MIGMETGGCLLVLLLILAVLSRKEAGTIPRRMASFWEKTEERLRSGEKNPKTEKNAEAVFGGSIAAKKEYYIRKKERLVYVLLAGAVLVTISGVMDYRQVKNMRTVSVERPDYEEGNTSYVLHYEVEDEEEQEIQVDVQNRKYTREEIRTIFTEVLNETDRNLKGENESFDRITKPLVLPKSMKNGLISVEWKSDPYGIIREDGTLSDSVPEEGVLVELTATLTYQREIAVYSRTVYVFPKELSSEELFRKTLSENLTSRDNEQKNDPRLSLPEEVAGKQILWFSREQGTTPWFLFLLLIAVAAVWIGEDLTLQKQAQERQDALQREYPDFLFRLNMLLGAGLTLQGAFFKIAGEYKKQKERGERKKEKAVYEELIRTCEEMEKGVSEAKAYENFGLRCQQTNYVKLGNLLAQNLKKGSAGLIRILENEAQAALEEQKAVVRKQGERAGVKLMFPMILLMAVVMAILIVPAMLSF